ncbi:hypothetical protein [Curtobacterium sp. MCPF17_052]
MFIGIAGGSGAEAVELHLDGERGAIRRAVVSELLARLRSRVRGVE